MSFILYLKHVKLEEVKKKKINISHKIIQNSVI